VSKSADTTLTQRIEARLEAVLQPTRMDVRDDSASHAGHQGHRAHGGGHFCLSIAATAFEGCSLAQCHRLVYQALNGMFSKDIHALSIHIDRD